MWKLDKLTFHKHMQTKNKVGSMSTASDDLQKLCDLFSTHLYSQTHVFLYPVDLNFGGIGLENAVAPSGGGQTSGEFADACEEVEAFLTELASIQERIRGGLLSHGSPQH